MKKVVLKRLTLTNFKGEKSRTTDFNADITTIAGDNGLGKTRHFDAFLWLLFGKDTLGRENYEIKTRVNGKELRKVDSSVEGVLEINGETCTLKRVWAEDWVKSQGELEPSYKGNHTDCFWNETPINVTEYKKRVASIIDETVFKMITNPVFFATMHWKNQREQLFQLAGTSFTDREIAAGNPEFEKLLDSISGKSFSDYKKEIATKKKNLKDALKDIQPRIDQTYKIMPEEKNWDELTNQKNSIDEQIRDIDGKIADHSKYIKGLYDEEQKKVQKINDLKKKQKEVIYNAQNDATEAANKANSERRNLLNQINADKNQVSHLNAQIERDKKSVENINVNIANCTKQQDDLRNTWFAEDAKQYSGDSHCPHCGQLLPESMRQNAINIFNETKKKKLAEITSEGKQLQAKIDSYKAEAKTYNDGIEKNEAEVVRLTNTINTNEATLANTPLVTAAPVVNTDLKDWVDLENQIQAISATLSTDTTPNADNSELTAQKAELVKQRDAIIKDLNTKDEIAKLTKEIDSLNSQAKDYAQQIADIEKSEFTMAEFSKKKIEDCETRINSMFKIVKFRLFDYTIEGNESETCVPMVNGVPWNTANDAGKINAGLDIINTLIRFYDVSAPIFIDRKESINQPMPMDAQVIYLKVTEDKELKVY